jgi:hypothetical protein
MDNQQQIVQLLKEQNELLKKHLARLKFSLMSLLLMMTATCCGLGFLVWARYHPTFFPSRHRYRTLTNAVYPPMLKLWNGCHLLRTIICAPLNASVADIAR